MLPGLILILLTLASCALFVFRPVWFPLAVTPDALAFDRQFLRTLWISGLLFIALQLLLAWSVLRKRTNSPGSRSNGHFRLEASWTALAVVLFLTLSITGSRSWAKVAVTAPEKETIEVYAHQFAWNFRYTGPDGKFGVTGPKFISDAGGNPFGIDPDDKAGRDDIVSATLRIPAGREVLLLLHSRDVIHDFFVRELRTKQDIVPGMEIPLNIRVDRPGTYEIACAELCGLGHSQMRGVLLAMDPNDYAAWKRAQETQR